MDHSGKQNILMLDQKMGELHPTNMFQFLDHIILESDLVYIVNYHKLDSCHNMLRNLLEYRVPWLMVMVRQLLHQQEQWYDDLILYQYKLSYIQYDTTDLIMIGAEERK